ncbi:MAG: caspase family protein [Polyangia bacterium]
MPIVAAILRLGGILLCLLGFSGDAAAALVQILSHRSGDEVAAGEVILLVKVTLDPGQALRELSVRVDGAPAGVPANVPGSSRPRSIAVDAQDLDPALHRLRLVLPAGSRQVEVTPVVTAGTATPARITLQARSPSEQDPLLRPRLYALLVGISRYHDPTLRLRFPSKDAADLAAVLRRQAGGLYRDVQVRLLTDEAASKTGVLDGLEWVQRQATARDVAVLFLAGHGIRDGRTGLYYFLPADAELTAIKRTLISQDEFHATLRSMPGKVLVFLDTCFAGQLMRRQDRSPPDIDRFVNELVSADSGLVVFASSSGRQTSQESQDWQNGAFTAALVEGLSGRAAPLGRGTVTLAMLELYLSERVKQLTGGMQTPMVARPEAVPDFPLALPLGPAAPEPPRPSAPPGLAPDGELRVDPFGQSFAVFRGPARTPISQPAFFRLLARPDLLDRLEARSSRRRGLLLAGGVSLALGAILAVAGAAKAVDADLKAGLSGTAQGLLAGAGLAGALGLGLLIGGAMLRPDPVSAEEAQALAEAHNARLRYGAAE